MKKDDIKQEVIDVLSKGDKRWKYLEVIHKNINQDRQQVRNAIADLMDEGKVTANLDPINNNPVYALSSRF